MSVERPRNKQLLRERQLIVVFSTKPRMASGATHKPPFGQGPARAPGAPSVPLKQPGLPRKHLSYAGAAAASRYEEIADKAKGSRNAIVAKIINPSDTAGAQRGLLSPEDWCEFLFDILEINPNDMVGIDFYSGNKSSVEMLMTKSYDVTKLVDTKYEFKGYKVEISRVLMDETKVVFFNVPLYVPDEEILHLVESYGGEMKKNEVQYEYAVHGSGITTKKGKLIKIRGTTRYVHATFPANKFLRRYYWLEGPCRHDPGRRIMVQHKGQKMRQCGHCLQWASDCPYQAKTNMCREGSPNLRKPLAQYTKEVLEQDGYESLKMKYCGMLDLEEQEIEGRGIHDHQIYEYEDMAGEMLSEDQRKSSSQIGAAKVENNKTLASKTNPTSNDRPTKDQQEKKEADQLTKKLAEKEKELESLKKEQQKIKAEVSKLKTENNTIRRDQEIDRKNHILHIREKLMSGLDWSTTREYTSTMAANIMDKKQFLYDDAKDMVTVKEGESPWMDLRKILDFNPTDKQKEERFKDLQGRILGRLKERLSEKKSRSESVTRNRSETDQEEEEQLAKKTKEEKTKDDQEEEEQLAKKTKEEKTKDDSTKMKEEAKAKPKSSPVGKNKKKH